MEKDKNSQFSDKVVCNTNEMAIFHAEAFEHRNLVLHVDSSGRTDPTEKSGLQTYSTGWILHSRVVGLENRLSFGGMLEFSEHNPLGSNGFELRGMLNILELLITKGVLTTGKTLKVFIDNVGFRPAVFGQLGDKKDSHRKWREGENSQNVKRIQQIINQYDVSFRWEKAHEKTISPYNYIADKIASALFSESGFYGNLSPIQMHGVISMISNQQMTGKIEGRENDGYYKKFLDFNSLIQLSRTSGAHILTMQRIQHTKSNRTLSCNLHSSSDTEIELLNVPEHKCNERTDFIKDLTTCVLEYRFSEHYVPEKNLYLVSEHSLHGVVTMRSFFAGRKTKTPLTDEETYQLETLFMGINIYATSHLGYLSKRSHKVSNSNGEMETKVSL